MAPPSINPAGRQRSASEHIPASGSNAACYPCDASAAETLSAMAMQLDAPPRRRRLPGAVADSAMAMSEEEETKSSTFAAPLQLQEQQQQQQRRTTVPPINNVGELVAKAKKAAISLWMILHAQNCRLSDDVCSHRGCGETKRLLAHVRTCPAAGRPNFPCPANCKGCNETRKLLAHYRRCKDMRLKQVGSGRRSGSQPDQSCLVCSLMARYAKGVMDKGKGGQGSGGGSGRNGVTSLLCNSTDGKFKVERELANFPVVVDRGAATRCVAIPTAASSAASSSPISIPIPRRTPSMTLMPPPPPRLQSSSPVETNMSNESFDGTPPTHSSSQFMDPKLASVASALTNLSTPVKRSSCSMMRDDDDDDNDPSLQHHGNSADNSSSTAVRIPFPILRNHRADIAMKEQERLVVPGQPSNNTTMMRSATLGRQRSVSYDERKPRVKFSPTIICKRYYNNNHFDENKVEEEEIVEELQQHRQQQQHCHYNPCDDAAAADHRGSGGGMVRNENQKLGSPARPRSSSCINMGQSSRSNASLSSGLECEAIDEHQEWGDGT